MNKEFWFKKWKINQIGFHESVANPLLVNNLDSLSLHTGSRVFVPLCGKSLDVAWLLSQGYKVVAIELVETAIEQLFEGLGVKPEIAELGSLKVYRAPNLDVFVGDIFNLSKDELGSIDAIYDRAAFVALPEEMRRRYVAHVADISNRAPQLLITFEYDETRLSGPPFSHNREQVEQFFTENYDVTLLTCEEVKGGFKGHLAKEHIWHLEC